MLLLVPILRCFLAIDIIRTMDKVLCKSSICDVVRVTLYCYPTFTPLFISTSAPCSITVAFILTTMHLTLSCCSYIQATQSSSANFIPMSQYTMHVTVEQQQQIVIIAKRRSVHGYTSREPQIAQGHSTWSGLGPAIRGSCIGNCRVGSLLIIS
jgi:hypothetical protein